MLAQRFQLAGKDQLVAALPVVQGLFPEAVAGKEQTTAVDVALASPAKTTATGGTGSAGEEPARE